MSRREAIKEVRDLAGLAEVALKQALRYAAEGSARRAAVARRSAAKYAERALGVAQAGAL